MDSYPNYTEKEYLVDVANVCGLKSDNYNKPKIEIFENVVDSLKNLGVKNQNIMGFADSSFKYAVNDIRRYNQLIRQGLICETPAGVKADQCILAYCLKHEGVLIITNDLMREYYQSLPEENWIVEKRITVMLVRDEILLIPMLAKVSEVQTTEVILETEESEKEITTLDILNLIENSEGEFNLYNNINR